MRRRRANGNGAYNVCITSIITVVIGGAIILRWYEAQRRASTIFNFSASLHNKSINCRWNRSKCVRVIVCAETLPTVWQLPIRIENLRFELLAYTLIARRGLARAHKSTNKTERNNKIKLNKKRNATAFNTHRDQIDCLLLSSIAQAKSMAARIPDAPLFILFLSIFVSFSLFFAVLLDWFECAPID